MPNFLQSSLIQAISRKILPGFLCGLCLVTTAHLPVTAQTAKVNRAEITQILDSSQVFIQNKQAKVKDAASRGQQVRTGNARAQVLFNTGAIGRLSRNSVLTVGQKCARLRAGTLLVNGAMNGCTSSVVDGVRGTTYLLEVDETEQATIRVLEGEVTITRLTNPNQAEEDAEMAIGNKQLPPRLPTTPTIIPPLPETVPPVAPTPPPLPESPLPDPSLQRNTPLLQVEEPGKNESPILKVETPSQNEPIVLQEGEKVSVRPDGTVGLVEKLSQEEFTQLLTSGLFNGFSIPLPGIGKIQQSFQRLYPGVPFPISIPGIPLPSIPTPPVRIPFPF